VGFGYGTFTIQAAKVIKGTLHAFDIESEMLQLLKQKNELQLLTNVLLQIKDILTQTTGLPDSSVDYVMLFNLLHNEQPGLFFNEAYRILKPKGKLGIIHWRSDIDTPRGPNLDIRPDPEQILEKLDSHKFDVLRKPFLLEPFHFGLLLSKM